MHQSSEEVVETRVEVLRERGHGLLAVEQLRGRDGGRGRGRDAETDAASTWLGRVVMLLLLEGLDLVAEEVRREAEVARVPVEDRHQVVRDHVAVRI